MKIENHIAMVFASTFWIVGASLSLFIFWPFVAVVSILVGFFLTKLLPSFNAKEILTNSVASMLVVVAIVFGLGQIGYTQAEWQAMLYFVVLVQLVAFYAGGLFSIWRHRATSHT